MHVTQAIVTTAVAYHAESGPETTRLLASRAFDRNDAEIRDFCPPGVHLGQIVAFPRTSGLATSAPAPTTLPRHSHEGCRTNATHATSNTLDNAIVRVLECG